MSVTSPGVPCWEGMTRPLGGTALCGPHTWTPLSLPRPTFPFLLLGCSSPLCLSPFTLWLYTPDHMGQVVTQAGSRRGGVTGGSECCPKPRAQLP